MARHHWCNARRQLAVDIESDGRVDIGGHDRRVRHPIGVVGQKGRGSIEAGVSGRCQHEDDSPHSAKRRASPLAAWPA
jgi:hypothetical protein